MRYQLTIITDAPETLDGLQPGQWIAYGGARGRFMGHRNGCAWIAWGSTATKRFHRFAAAFAVAAVTVSASIAPAAASAPRAFVMNSQGGVIACRLAATDTEVEYCAGEIDNPAADPRRFDCRKAEVDSEFQFCGLPYPRRRR